MQQPISQRPIPSSQHTHPIEVPSLSSAPTPRKAPLVGIIGVSVLVLGLVGWTATRIVSASGKQKTIAAQRTEDAARNLAAAKAPPKVKVVQPSDETWAPVVELDGTLEAGQRAELGFKIAGRLSQVSAKLGQDVKSGALVAVLDSGEAGAQLRAAQAQTRAAEAQLALANDNQRRTASMVTSGSMAEAAGVQTTQSQALAQAQADAARAQVNLIQASLENHRLIAPFAGTITQAPDGVGSVVSPGITLFEIADLSTLKLKGTLSEGDAALVGAGSKIEITTEHGKTEGTLTTVLNAVDPATRRVRVEATINNKKEPKLRAGSFVKGTIRAGAPIRVQKLPHETLRPGTDDQILAVVGDHVELRRITYTTATDGSLLVRFGLGQSERVVLSPKPELEPGQTVNLEAAPEKAP
jgi:RND family efflux transporter MFP subunit